MSLTKSQERAVRARGNVVLSAGAGTGKTKTLVERCLSCLLDEKSPASISEMLLVTFTEAAAAEMRHRIRARLEEESGRDPGNSRWQEQLALFEQAHIGTLHSFCLKLVRQHFHELQLDPQLAVMPEEEIRFVSEETLESIFERHYNGQTEASAAVRDLIFSYGRGGDTQVRRLVRRLHTYRQTLPDPEGWLRAQQEMFASAEPSHWERWLLGWFAGWREEWILVLSSGAHENVVGQGCLKALKGASSVHDRKLLGKLLDEVQAACLAYPKGKKTAFVTPLKEFTKEVEFMQSLVPSDQGDPLREDWDWVRRRMGVLLELAEAFGQEFAEAKRQSGMVDFQDLEQHALKLLWDAESGRPTAVAEHWRKQLRFVFVDEYQDINAAQDRIVEALSRDGEAANRFLVGDVKQSIYRFRLANPRIFQHYMENWGGRRCDGVTVDSATVDGIGTTDYRPQTTDHRLPPADHRPPTTANSQSLPLLDNFRTRERLLDFINSVFELVMRPESGGIAYDETARLVFGAPEQRKMLSGELLPEPCVELHLRLKSRSNQANGSEENGEADEALAEVADLEEASREARLLGLSLKSLKDERFQVWDVSEFRAMRWSDAAVLLRSPAAKAENYAREFARLNIPLVITRSRFYEGLEIKDLLSLLQILDNPMQDAPLVAVLRSPFVGLSLEELGEVRLVGRGFYWLAVSRFAVARVASGAAGQGGTREKVAVFLERYKRWRRLARQGSISKCLETVLAETEYDEWLASQPRGRQRRANVEQFLGLARQFDSFQRQGLFRFLRFLEAQQEADLGPDAPEASGEDAVRLMSIHQSKGLEFPVVALGDLGKTFNTSDLKGQIILDDHYGLCPQVRPPGGQAQYPSVAHWLARRRQHAELLGDELRLLYVAMTRARDRLILAGSISEKKLEAFFESPTGLVVKLPKARTYADWIGFWLGQTVVGEGGSPLTPGQEKVVERVGNVGGSGSETLPKLAGGDACATTGSETGNEEGPGLAGTQGRNELLQWRFYSDEELALAVEPGAAEEIRLLTGDGAGRGERGDAEWHYPFEGATREPAKASVSALKRRAFEEDEMAARPAYAPLVLRPLNAAPGKKKLTATEIGTAHHVYLEQLDLGLAPTPGNLQRECERMVNSGRLEKRAAAALDLAAIGSFWSSEVGQMVRSEASRVKRELAFTARFLARDLAPLFAIKEAYEGDEPVIVQGTADLVVLMPSEIWLLDFKTDRVDEQSAVERMEFYRPQLELYARALEMIHGRPVTRRWLHFLEVRKTFGV